MLNQNNFNQQKQGSYTQNNDYSNTNQNHYKESKTFYKQDGQSQSNNTWKERYGNYFTFDNKEYERLLQEHLFHLNNKKNFNFDKLMATQIFVYSKDTLISTKTCDTFKDLNLNQCLIENLVKMQFNEMTPIQKTVVPLINENVDIMGCAQTGSGKTLCFLLPVINRMMVEGPPKINMNNSVSYPVVLILVPVRELAEQIFNVAKLLTNNTFIRVTKLYGGVPHDTQTRDLKQGVDIIISTTGRILDFLHSRISLSAVKFLIIDEADRLLDMGFEKQLNEILTGHDMTEKEKRQNLLFSATFSKEIQSTVRNALSPNYLLCSNNVEDYVVNDNIEQLFVRVEDKDKPYQLHQILQQCRGTAIIFMEKKRSVDYLTNLLRKGNYNCASIHGDKSQNERNAVVESFKSGNIPILIATDVIGRGIDFPNVSYIFNYDMPKNIDDYVHRIGRTGRCGNNGQSISFLNDNNLPIISDLYGLLKKQSKVIPEFIEEMAVKNRGYGNSYNNRNFNSWK